MFRNTPSPRPRLLRTRQRSLAMETLERRDMLTAGPRVIGVEVGSTSWTPAFVKYLGDHSLSTADPHQLNWDQSGYAIPLGSSAQSNVLPWTGLDQIRIKFETSVSISAGALSVSGVNRTAYAFSSFKFVPTTGWATWTLVTPIGSDRLQLDLDANGINPVRDFSGNLLDGDWTNNSSTISGDGTAGGDFEFRFNVQPADVNNSTSVTTTDYSAIEAKSGLTVNSAGYSAKHDINGDGTIDSADSSVASSRNLEALPTGNPAGVGNDAPTAMPFGRYSLSNSANSFAVALPYSFGDAENGNNGLTYSIVSSSGSNLLSSASINSTTKQLTVTSVTGAEGVAALVIRVTDSGGLFVDSPIKIDVNHYNLPPQIDGFWSIDVGAGTRYFWGQVSDADTTLSDLVVYIYGDFFETFAAVDENGRFQFAVILEEGAIGEEWAFVYDTCDNWSDAHVAPINQT